MTAKKLIAELQEILDRRDGEDLEVKLDVGVHKLFNIASVTGTH